MAEEEWPPQSDWQFEVDVKVRPIVTQEGDVALLMMLGGVAYFLPLDRAREFRDGLDSSIARAGELGTN